MAASLSAAPKKAAPKSIVDSFSELAGKLLQTRTDGKKPSYAFVALTADDGNALAEDYVTDALTEAVFNTGKIKIYERANLEKILSEQKFQASGLVDEDTAKDIGKIAGVDYICYGTLKTLGDNITVNVRVVDVQNGEICAMSRATVEKDTYLKNIKYEARKNSGTTASNKTPSTTSTSTTNASSTTVTPTAALENAKKKAANSAWKVSKVRNDFDGETIYSMKCMNPDGTFLFFGYEKADNALNSRVRCSLSWNGFRNNYPYSMNTFDFKIDSGNIVKIKPSKDHIAYWDNKFGWIYDKASDSQEKIYNNDVATSKQLFQMFLNSSIIQIRDLENVRPFQTEGFLEVLTANGITVDEINKAFGNESF